MGKNHNCRSLQKNLSNLFCLISLLIVPSSAYSQSPPEPAPSENSQIYVSKTANSVDFYAPKNKLRTRINLGLGVGEVQLNNEEIKKELNDNFYQKKFLTRGPITWDAFNYYNFCGEVTFSINRSAYVPETKNFALINEVRSPYFCRGRKGGKLILYGYPGNSTIQYFDVNGTKYWEKPLPSGNQILRVQLSQGGRYAAIVTSTDRSFSNPKLILMEISSQEIKGEFYAEGQVLDFNNFNFSPNEEYFGFEEVYAQGTKSVFFRIYSEDEPNSREGCSLLKVDDLGVVTLGCGSENEGTFITSFKI